LQMAHDGGPDPTAPRAAMTDRGWLLRILPVAPARWAAGGFLFAAPFLAVLVLRSTLVEPFRIPSSSMLPTLEIGDHVLAAKYVYNLQLPLLGTVRTLSTPARGDIVTFRFPRDRGLTYMKRVVGIPGDRVAFRANRVVLNGVELVWTPDAPYEGVDDNCTVFASDRWQEVMGGRAWSIVTNQGVAGPLANRPEVEVPAGHVFVVGDSRDSSADSRAWGTVPIEDVTGQVQVVGFSEDPCGESVRPWRFGLSLVPAGS